MLSVLPFALKPWPMVRGYHTYQSVCTAVVGEELPCQRETVNPRDPFTVAVLKDEAIVGHVPKEDILYLLTISSSKWFDQLSSYWIQALFRGSRGWRKRCSAIASYVRAYKSIVAC